MRYNFKSNSMRIDLYRIYKHKPQINFPSKFATNKNFVLQFVS